MSESNSPQGTNAPPEDIPVVPEEQARADLLNAAVKED